MCVVLRSVVFVVYVSFEVFPFFSGVCVHIFICVGFVYGLCVCCCVWFVCVLCLFQVSCYFVCVYLFCFGFVIVFVCVVLISFISLCMSCVSFSVSV